MNQIQSHRGPDDSGCVFLEQHRVGLAHRRLSIIDLTNAGHQPMWDVSNRYCIIFNGEIYNYKELRTDLLRDGCSIRSGSDTEVLLNLYIRHGDQMFKYVNGIFAFAIWDSVAEELLIARDPYGVKPLYYTENEKGLLFASELKAILCEPSVKRNLDPVAIASYVSYLWCPAPRTPILAAKKLEPGWPMRVQSNGVVRKWEYAQLPQTSLDRNVDESTSPQELATQVRGALRLAVERQMVADVPVGAFLSGGLDSSSIVAFAKDLSSRKLQCFTIAFRGSNKNWEGFSQDWPYADRVAKYLGVDLHTITVGPEMADAVPEMIYQLDEPQADLAPLNTLFICQLAKQHGIKVLLSGAGGDDLFTGYRRHLALRLEKYWNWLPVKFREGIQKGSQLIPSSSALLRRLKKGVENAAMTADDRLMSYFHWMSPINTLALMNREFRATVSPPDMVAPFKDTLASAHKSCTSIDKMLLLETKFFLPDHNLNYTDKMSMAVGVETRVPFLDPDLITLAGRIRDKYKQKGTCGKWILKKAMEPVLPRSIIYRPKTGFGVPLRHWMKGPLAERIHDQLSAEAINRYGLFDCEAINELVTADQQGRIDAAYPLFAIFAIQTWCDRFLRQP